MTDLAQLDATAQAELVRSGEASPLELVDAAIARIEKLNPELNAVIHPLLRLGARRGAGRRCPTVRSAACRCCSRTSCAGDRRRPAPRGHAVPEGRGLPRTTTPTRSRGSTSTPGFVVRRAHEHARARPRADHRARGVRPDAQPVGHDAHDRRVERRVGGGGRERHGRGRARERRRRLDPHPRELLRARRAEAVARPHVAGPGLQRRSTTCSSPSCA